MEVKVLGCYGRYAPVDCATSGYLIKTSCGKNIVLDLGAGCLSTLQEYIDIEQIDMIILSHLHFDHVSDIGILKYARGYLGLDNIDLYMPKTPSDMFGVLSSGYNANIINDGLVVNCYGVGIKFVSNHHPVETYAVEITEGQNILVYTSDCMTAEDVIRSTANANCVIGDACILHRDWRKNAPHLSVKMLSESVPADAKLYLSHLTSGDEQEILDEASNYHDNCQLIIDFKM